MRVMGEGDEEREGKRTLRGDFSDDFRMIAFPAATAGPSLLTSMRVGTLKGSCERQKGAQYENGEDKERGGRKRTIPAVTP